MAAKPTHKQREYLDALATNAGFTDPAIAVATAGFREPITSLEMSMVITKLKDGLTPPAAAPTTAPTGGMTLHQAVDLLGHRIEVTGRGPRRGDLENLTDPVTFPMDVTSVCLSPDTGLPCIGGRRVDNPHDAGRHLHLIESWTVIS